MDLPFLNASPCNIMAGDKGCETITLPYPALRDQIGKHPCLKGALHEDFVRSIGIKHGSLEMPWFDRNAAEGSGGSSQKAGFRETQKHGNPETMKRATA